MSPTRAEAILDHLTTHLGEWSCGWTVEGSGEGTLQLLQYSRRPAPEASTVVTYGVSRHRLQQRRGVDLRLELVVAALTEQLTPRVRDLLTGFALHVLETHSAPPRGSCHGRFEPVAPGSVLTSFVLLEPGYWPASFEACPAVGEDVQTFFLWLLPVSAAERSYVEESGVDALLDSIAERDIDLLDLCRPSVIP